jgi:hypothetical protein
VSVTVTRVGFYVTVSPTALGKKGTISTLTTPAAVATPTGGVGPYTYAWTKQSGGAITANSPSSYSTTFTATGLGVDEERDAVFRVTCTDSLAATATRDITVSILRYSFA